LNTPNIQYWRHLESLVCRGVFPHTSGDREVYHGGHVAFYNYNDLSYFCRGWGGYRMHTRGLPYDPPPPIWQMLGKDCGVKSAPSNIQMSYGDLIFSAVK